MKSTKEMKQEILNSPMAETRGVERIKQMLERHDETFVKHMYQSLVDDEDLAMVN